MCTAPPLQSGHSGMLARMLRVHMLGACGARRLMSALACLANQEGAIQQVFLTDEYNEYGKYRVRLFDRPKVRPARRGTRPRLAAAAASGMNLHPGTHARARTLVWAPVSLQRGRGRVAARASAIIGGAATRGPLPHVHPPAAALPYLHTPPCPLCTPCHARRSG